MKKRALLIGINDYFVLNKLNYARQDAESIADILKAHCGFSDGEITLMTCGSSGATRATARFIEHAMADLTECRDLDLLIFGFWGHGFAPEPGKRYLCGIDTVEKDLERSAVSLDLTKAKLAQVGAMNTLLLLDCCQNRPAGRSAGAAVLEDGAELQLASMARDIQAAHREDSTIERIPTVAILNACREGQKAYEWDDRRHGVFTAHLLDGIESGKTSIAQLSTFVCDRTPSTVRKLYRENQIPWFTFEGKGDIQLKEESGREKVVAKKKIKPENLKRVRQEIRKWVRDNDAEWSKDQWKDFVLQLYDSGVASGFPQKQLVFWRDEKKRVRLEEKRRRLEEEKRRKEEEKRRAEELRRLEEEKLWLQIQKSPSQYLCEDYLSRFPNGKFVSKVQEVPEKLEEEKLYYQIQEAPTISLCREYLTLFPKGRSADKVQKILTKLKRESLVAVAPFGTNQAKEYQKQTADALSVLVEKTLSLGHGFKKMEFVLIPPGEFLMGSPEGEGEEDEHPQHEVQITQPFYMGIYPVTQAQYKTVTGTNPSYFKGKNLPVENVSWHDAIEFCQKLSDRESKIYRLPTEAQWEYACRAGTTTRFYFGDNGIDLGYYAWFDDNRKGKTHPVGKKKPNAFGLYDMHGHVLEWCFDWYDEDYYSKSPEVDPCGPKRGEYRVLRGGSWDIRQGRCRSAYRIWCAAGCFGFRVVLLDL